MAEGGCRECDYKGSVVIAEDFEKGKVGLCELAGNQEGAGKWRIRKNVEVSKAGRHNLNT